MQRLQLSDFALNSDGKYKNEDDKRLFCPLKTDESWRKQKKEMKAYQAQKKIKLSKLLQKHLEKISKQLFELENNNKKSSSFPEEQSWSRFSPEKVQVLQMQNMNKNKNTQLLFWKKKTKTKLRDSSGQTRD